MTNTTLGKGVIATTLKALSVSIFDHWIDLQNKHALFSFFMQTKRRTKYYDFKSYASMVTLYGKEAFQCSYSSPLYSKKVWKKCREKENWNSAHDVIARILSQDSSIRGECKLDTINHPRLYSHGRQFTPLSQIKIIVWQLDFQATAILSGLIQTSGRKNASVVGKVWIATTLKDLSITMFYYGVDLQHKHALFSFLTQTKARKQYHDFNSYSSAVFQFGKEAFQCSYTKAVKSKKVWERCKEKENWEFPLHDVVARMQSEDASAISKAIQAVALVLNAVSFSQWSKRRMHVGGNRLPQIIQPWQ
ncbi:hypothetical protein E2320_023049, partial [Naja naja]